MQITLILAGRPRTVEADQLERATSPSTGRPLRCLRLNVGLSGNDEDAVRSELYAARRSDRALEDADGGRWIVSDFESAWGETCEASFDVDLIEVEDLTVESIALNGVTCKVNWYHDNGNDLDSHDPLRSLLLKVEFEAASADVEQVEELLLEGPTYFDLVRITPDGALDSVRARFGGKARWQASEGDSKRYLVNFVVPPSEDEDEPLRGRPLFDPEPETYNTQRGLLGLMASHEALLKELQASGVLDAAALRRVRENMTLEPVERQLFGFFMESRDLEQYRRN